MINCAKNFLPDVDFRVMNMYDLSKLKERFDGFWACAALLHIPKSRVDEVFSALNHVLKKGAVGFISIKHGNKEEFEVREKNNRHEERLFVYWEKQDFDRVLKRNGYEVLSYEFRPVSERTNWHIYFVQKSLASGEGER